jgi:hypothetical protein
MIFWRVVQMRVTYLQTVEVADSIPARQGNLPVAQRPERETYLHRLFPLRLNHRAVVQPRVTSISNREVAGSNPARQIDLPVAQGIERFVPLSFLPRTVFRNRAVVQDRVTYCN